MLANQKVKHSMVSQTALLKANCSQEGYDNNTVTGKECLHGSECRWKQRVDVM